MTAVGRGGDLFMEYYRLKQTIYYTEYVLGNITAYHFTIRTSYKLPNSMCGHYCFFSLHTVLLGIVKNVGCIMFFSIILLQIWPKADVRKPNLNKFAEFQTDTYIQTSLNKTL